MTLTLTLTLTKITGLGPRQYFRYKWNLFDFFLVVVQVCTSVSTAAAYLGGGEYLTLNLSYIRSMRVLRLARYSRSVRLVRVRVRARARVWV